MITINIVNGANTVSWEPTDDVVLSAGSHASFSMDTRENEVRILCDIPSDWKETFYNSTLECIEQHQSALLNNAGTRYPVDFRPSTANNNEGYYVTSINKISGILGRFDIVGGPNCRWAPATAGLTIADMTRPDVDCLDYIRIAGYLTKIEEVANGIATQISGTPSDSGSSPDVYGLWKQYQALREMWNYLVIRSMVVFNVEHQGNRLFVKARFRNPSGATLPVGNLTIGFPPCAYNGLFLKAWSSDNNGNGLDWTTASAKFQNMSTGSWTVSPSTTCSVSGGGYIEVTAVFLVFQTSLDSSVQVKIARDIAPWANKLPVIGNGRVSSAGWLSWERTHFNPTTYGATVPPGLPPTGDGCTMRRSNGTVTMQWITNGAIQSTRPALHMDWYCNTDNSSATFADFTATVTPETEDPNGTFSLQGAGTYSTLKWTPTGGSSPVDVLRLVLGDTKHFHQGDHISLDVPEGWNVPVDAANVKLSCIWDIPVNTCIVDAAKAGGVKWMQISYDERYKKTVPARNGDNNYDVEQIRSIVLHN